MLDELKPFMFLSTEKMLNSARYRSANDIAYMNYSTFEEQFVRQQQQQNEKHGEGNSRKHSHHNASDIESDCGSDGLAVHSSGSSLSGGSGRSGDWGRPKIRHRTKQIKKRSERRNSLTDSGISISKNDAGHAFEYYAPQQRKKSQGNLQTDGYRHLISNHVTKYGKNKQVNQNLPSMTRAKSCSALPSDAKQFENPVLCSQKEVEIQQKDIEEKENAILQQCYRNEGLLKDCPPDCSYIVDCKGQQPSSSFPLPEHLNYPLCKYRHKSELNLGKTSPLKKIRSGFKKIKPRRAFSTPTESVSNTLSSEASTTFDEFLYDDEEENNDTILQRLSRDPKERKSIIKRFISKIQTRSYSTAPIDEEMPKFKSSVSTASIPDALKDMWHQVHDVTLEQNKNPYPGNKIQGMTRAVSMPLIPLFQPQIEELTANKNRFTNFIKQDACLNSSKSKQTLVNGDDVITGVLGMPSIDLNHDKNIERTPKRSVTDAELSSVTDVLDNNKENINFIDTPKPTISRSILKHSASFTSELSTEILSEYSTTSHGSTARRRKVSHPSYTNQRKISFPFNSYQHHCPCCKHSQFRHLQMPTQHNIPEYEVANESQFYQIPLEKPQYLDNPVIEQVLAPLDVRVSGERKAERRKISEMLFDTFV